MEDGEQKQDNSENSTEYNRGLYNLFKVLAVKLIKKILAEQMGNHFEGDLILNPIQIVQLLSKTGIKNTNYRWANGIIPYQIANDYSKFDKF